ncbi:MAG: ATP synthase F0 subunit B [Terriglobia bacterium]
MNRTLRQAALFSLLGICLAGFASPRMLWAQVSAKQANSEAPHEVLYKTINFIILAGALGYILRKPLAGFFISRSASIQKSLDEGRKALEASQSQLKAVEEKLRGLEAEIAEFKAAATREMEAERERLQKSSAEEAARILESARAQTDTAVRGAKLELKNYAALKSVALAEQLIRTRLDDSGRKRLVAQFTATLGTKS